MKWFLPFLIFIFFGELSAKFQFYILGKNTWNIYRLIVIGEIIFYGFLFFSLSDRTAQKKVIKFLTLLNLVVYAILSILSFFDKRYYYYGITASEIIIAITSLLYLYEYVSDNDKLNLITEPSFWIALGTSFFFSVTSLSLSLHEVIQNKHLLVFGASLHNTISRILSVILYSSLSIAIILCKKKTRISSLPS